MPRQPRTISPTGWYHLINRGADRQDTFSRDADYVHFESLIGEASADRSIEVHAYCLMTNHFHLVVNAPDGRVSDFMREITGKYSQGYNRRNGRIGPLFAGRYRSIAVERDEQLVTLGRYVHRNPLSFVPLTALSTYRWSSYGVYCGRRTVPGWLRTGVLGASSSCTSYRHFVETPMAHDQADPLTWARVPRPTIEELEETVAELLGTDPSSAHVGDRSGGDCGRMLAVMLAVELRLASATELAPRFGFASADVLRNCARRGRIRAATEPSFHRLRCAVLDSLAGRHDLPAALFGA